MSFFSRHPKLHTLSLVQAPALSPHQYIELKDLPEDALPNLKHFVGQLSNATVILGSGRQGIESIGGVTLDEGISGQYGGLPWFMSPLGALFLEGLMRQPLLVELDVSTDSGIRQDAFERVVRAAPKLKKLRWRGYSIGSWVSGRS